MNDGNSIPEYCCPSINLEQILIPPHTYLCCFGFLSVYVCVFSWDFNTEVQDDPQHQTTLDVNVDDTHGPLHPAQPIKAVSGVISPDWVCIE